MKARPSSNTWNIDFNPLSITIFTTFFFHSVFLINNLPPFTGLIQGYTGIDCWFIPLTSPAFVFP